MIRLVALDIDGTLIAPGAHHSAQPEPDMVAAVHDLVRCGVEVVLASGRMYPGTASVARHLGLSTPVVCQQGAATHERDGSLRRSFAIDEEIALALRAYADAAGWASAWFDPRRYLVTRSTRESEAYAAVSGVPMEIHANPESLGVTPTGLDIISSPRAATTVHDDLARQYGERLALLDFPSVTAIHAPEASKGRAIADLAAEWGIGAHEVLAIGDSVNDVSMLEWAGESAAPAHATPPAQRAAKEVLRGEGVAGVVARLRAVASSN